MLQWTRKQVALRKGGRGWRSLESRFQPHPEARDTFRACNGFDSIGILTNSMPGLIGWPGKKPIKRPKGTNTARFSRSNAVANSDLALAN